MTSIVSTKNVEYHEWLTEVLNNLEKDSERINKMILISLTTDGDILVDYKNCSTLDFVIAGGELFKESIKEEIKEELAWEDDYDGEYDTEDEV